MQSSTQAKNDNLESPQNNSATNTTDLEAPHTPTTVRRFPRHSPSMTYAPLRPSRKPQQLQDIMIAIHVLEVNHSNHSNNIPSQRFSGRSLNNDFMDVANRVSPSPSPSNGNVQRMMLTPPLRDQSPEIPRLHFINHNNSRSTTFSRESDNSVDEFAREISSLDSLDKVPLKRLSDLL